MHTESAKRAIEERLRKSASERERTRLLIAQRRGLDAEQDSNRRLAYELNMARGRESQQGGDDLMSAAFLSEGACVRRAVALVSATQDSAYIQGTGFLISPRLFITNNHVILDENSARAASIDFDFELDDLNRRRPVTTFRARYRSGTRRLVLRIKHRAVTGGCLP